MKIHQFLAQKVSFGMRNKYYKNIYIIKKKKVNKKLILKQ